MCLRFDRIVVGSVLVYENGMMTDDCDRLEIAMMEMMIAETFCRVDTARIYPKPIPPKEAPKDPGTITEVSEVILRF